MQHQPFSVYTSVYKNDDAAFVDRALESITDKQTVKPNEVVLVVDGPISEEVNKVVEKYSKRKEFKIIRLKENVGHGGALKLSSENCSYDLIAKMDADDVSSPERFEKLLSFLEKNPDVDVVGGNISEFIDSEDNVVAYRNVPTTDSDIKKYLKKRCPMNHVTIMMKKESMLKAGGYLHWFCDEDYYLWIRMFLNKANFANIDETLVNVRIGKEMYGRRGGKEYFRSEKKLQKFMLKNKIIGRFTYFSNVTKRFIVQRLLPNSIRGFVFRKLARSNKKK
ncbi:MAG: glycosyltransferase [Bacilli bacterium]|nr:glycosyltransferase [Bacilli bacterium]